MLKMSLLRLAVAFAVYAVLSMSVLTAQVTILDETLRNGVLPDGWVATNVAFSTAAGGYANMSASNATLVTPVLDLTFFESAAISYSVAKFGSGADGPVTIEVSDDGGATFTIQSFDSSIPTSGTYIDDGPIALLASGNEVVVRFTTVNSASAKRLRDVVITGQLAPGVEVGCTDISACNYFVDAIFDDGSCLYIGQSCDDGDSTTVGDEINAECDCEGTPVPVPAIVINEIHYDPCQAQGPDNEWEFVELYNADDATIDLEGFVISGSINFVFPAGANIAEGEYIVLAVNSANYTGAGYQVFQWTTGALGNNSGTVTLSTDLSAVVNSVMYSSSDPWPTAPNGGCPSLELIDPMLDNSLASSWQASYVANGTPGAQNSSPAAAVNYTISEIQSDADAQGNSLLVGQVVATQGVVTGVYLTAGIFSLQDGPGPWSGIWVAGTGVQVGDEIEVIGTVIEQFGLTIINNVTFLDVQTQGNALPAPQPVFTADISLEQWEGVLLEVTGIVTTGDAGFGEWILNDGSGPARIDNLGIEVTPVDEGVQYTVIGPNYFSFGLFKLEPRDADDVLRWGCTDDTFANYDIEAQIENGSCSNAEGCTDPLADNYDPLAVIEDGSCFINGCTDDQALNYNPNATADNGSCYSVVPNIVINEIHYNPCEFQGSDFDYEFVEFYNAETSSIDLGGYVVSGSMQFVFPQGTQIASGEYIVLAINASFYEGNGYQVFQWTSGNLGNTTGNVTLTDGFGNQIAMVGYLNNTPWPFLANGSCPSLELIDPSFDPSDPASWQSSFVIFGTPGAQNSQNIQGCINQAACNYNPAAIGDDGSCEFTSCAGCTYLEAANYGPSATVDDGSCDFEPVSACPADLNNDGVINASDLSIFLSAFGTFCP